jgi:hypothetical protein
MPIGAVIVRVVASALLVGSGVLSIAGAYQRWWPACMPFDFDHPDCVKLQDSLYDYVMPSPPWVPMGTAASLAAVGLLLLGMAMLTMPLLMGRRYRLVTWGLCVGMALLPLFAAAGTWLSARAGAPVVLDGHWPAYFIWVWGWPAALFVLALVSILTVAPRQSAWRLLVFGCLAFSAPLVEFFGASLVMLYSPSDTTPWTGAVTGFALIIAGIALWPAFAQPAAGDEDHQDSGMAGPASEVEHVAPS